MTDNDYMALHASDAQKNNCKTHFTKDSPAHFESKLTFIGGIRVW